MNVRGEYVQFLRGDSRYEELARQATFVASKVSSDVYGVDTKISHLAEGRFKIGGGDTAKVLCY